MGFLSLPLSEYKDTKNPPILQIFLWIFVGLNKIFLWIFAGFYKHIRIIQFLLPYTIFFNEIEPSPPWIPDLGTALSEQ